MSRARRLILSGMLLALPLAASSCIIPTGQAGCSLLILEPGVEFGVVCNPF